MSTRTGANFRTLDVSTRLSELIRDVDTLAVAVSARSSAYTTGNFTTVTDSLDDTLAALAAAQSANDDNGNP